MRINAKGKASSRITFHSKSPQQLRSLLCSACSVLQSADMQFQAQFASNLGSMYSAKYYLQGIILKEDFECERL